MKAVRNQTLFTTEKISPRMELELETVRSQMAKALADCPNRQADLRLCCLHMHLAPLFTVKTQIHFSINILNWDKKLTLYSRT